MRYLLAALCALCILVPAKSFAHGNYPVELEHRVIQLWGISPSRTVHRHYARHHHRHHVAERKVRPHKTASNPTVSRRDNAATGSDKTRPLVTQPSLGAVSFPDGNLIGLVSSPRLQKTAYTVIGGGLVKAKVADGQTIVVHRSAADRFVAFFADLYERFKRLPEIGCYSASGHMAGSLHHAGYACDVGQSARNVAWKAMYHITELAHKHGLEDGATWRNPDAGHIQVPSREVGYRVATIYPDGRVVAYHRHHVHVRYAHRHLHVRLAYRWHHHWHRRHYAGV